MTPLAARLYRRGDSTIRSILGMCQFVEISAILDMAQEMGRADVDAGCDIYSELAQLPAPLTAVEYCFEGTRSTLLCEQHGNEIHYSAFYEIEGSENPADFRFTTGFVLGTPMNTPITWANFEGEPGYETPNARMPEGDLRQRTARSTSLLLEKALCILNQPGLVERLPRPTDKRVIRESAKDRLSAPPTQWFQCKIRHGLHGTAGDQPGADTSPRPLHYVRKHFKPSVQKWIEGYWRGDIELGVHLKWYSPQPSRAG
ncbi:hypothetical protein [Mesorhizobium sp. LjRoot246]|uniref:hypothetical protein n=1 Tax=Mesorhizobium sp. LjRoot246 TaxID=3342294 RepID=UPI003ED031DE